MILQDKQAKGDITAAEYEQKKQAMQRELTAQQALAKRRGALCRKAEEEKKF